MTDIAGVPGADRQRIGSVALGQLLLALAIGYPLCVAPQMAGGAVDLDGTANVDAAASNLFNQVFWLLLFLTSAYAARRVHLVTLAMRLLPLTLYLLWSFASILWAIAPEIVARRCLLQVFVVGSVLLPIALIDDAARVRETVLRVALVVLAVNLAALAVRAPTAIGHPGIYSHKNELGQMAGLILIACLCIGSAGSLGMRLAAWFGMPATVLLLIASRSKTSLLLALSIPALAWAVVIAARTCRLPPLVPLACAIGVLVPVGLLIAEAGGITLNSLLLAVFGDTTFTGRTDIWAFAVENIHARPWLGHGFNGFWGIGDASPATSSGDTLIASILQAHNGYLDLLLETGLIGFGLFMAFIATVLLQLRRVMDLSAASGAFVLALVLFGSVHNLLESTALRRFHPLWLFLLIAAGLVATARRTAKSQAEAGLRQC